MAFFSSSLTPAPAPTPALTERARLGTFRGFCTERARLGTFRGFDKILNSFWEIYIF